MTILHVPVTFANIAEWVRRAGQAINQLITGKQDQSDNLTSIAGLDLTGHAGDAIVVLGAEDGFELVAAGGGGGLSDGDYGDIVVSGSGTALNFDTGVVTAFAKTFLDDANAGAVLSTLGAQAAGSYAVTTNNLSDLSNAGTARSNLGLTIGTNVQAYNANLTTYAGIAPSANVQSLLGAANYAGIRTQLTLTVGTDVQAWDADLDALAALSGTNTIYYRSAANTWSAVTISPDLLFSGGVLGRNKGTSFPGSPSSGDRFTRTDRNIEYFYDGARWLSTTLYSMGLETQETSLNPITASNSNFRVTHPFWGIYDIYAEKYIVVMNNSATTAANYFTTRLETRDAGSSAQLGTGLSGQGDTQNQAVGHSENINSVIASTIEFILSVHTETGTASAHIAASLTYRLVG